MISKRATLLAGALALLSTAALGTETVEIVSTSDCGCCNG